MVKGYIFRQKTDSPARSCVPKTLAQHESVPAGRAHETHRQVDRRTLAGSVRTQETKDFSVLHLQ